MQLGDDVVGHQLGDAQHLSTVLVAGADEPQVPFAVEAVDEQLGDLAPPHPPGPSLLKDRHRVSPR